jgi:RNA-directed DNA polymerase
MIDSLNSLLHEASGLHPILVQLILKRAPHTYKKYHIKKRNGGKRLIAQPAKETKLIQRWLVKNVFKDLPIHSAAMAYRDNISIADNAVIHANNPYLVKADFSNFFNSIKISDIKVCLEAYLSDKFSEKDISKIAEVCCFSNADGELCLSVGAPSSPSLSNILMFEFDRILGDWCDAHEVLYTRYADDLTFSTKARGVSEDIIPFVREVLNELTYPKITLNEDKTVHSSKKFRREVTGLILDNTGKVSLGRERKREISALIHRFKLGVLEDEKAYKLQGLLGFANDAEPDFIIRMRQKYGDECLTSIFSLRKPGK